MKKIIFSSVIVLLFSGLFFITQASADAQITPVSIFQNAGQEQLMTVTGYPQDKPTLLFYSSSRSVQSEGLQTPIVPSVFITDDLSAALKVSKDQFKPINIESLNDAYLATILPSNESSSRTFHFNKIIWFGHAYYAVGTFELYRNLDNNERVRVHITKKIVALKSNDGLNWQMINSSDNLITAMDSDLDRYNDAEKISEEAYDIVAAGDSNNPTLFILINKGIYYKKLISKDQFVKADIHLLPDTIPQIYSYHNKILVQATTEDGYMEANDLNTFAIQYFMSNDGTKWQSLKFASDAVGNLAPDDNGGLIFCNLMEINDKDNNPLLGPNYYTLAKNKMESALKDYKLYLGKMVVNEKDASIGVEDKAVLDTRLESNLAIHSILKIAYLPNSATTGKYYIDFTLYPIIDSSEKNGRMNAIGVIDASESLQNIGKHISIVNFGTQFQGWGYGDIFLAFNKQIYIGANIYADPNYYHINMTLSRVDQL